MPAQITNPPVVIYLPSLMVAPRNTTTRIAEILTKLSDEGPGSYVRKCLQRVLLVLAHASRPSAASPSGSC